MEPETILRILNAGLSAAVDESRGPGQGARITLAAIDESIAKHTDPIARDFQRGQIVLFDLLKRAHEELARAREASEERLAGVRAELTELTTLHRGLVEQIAALTEDVRRLAAPDAREPKPTIEPEAPPSAAPSATFLADHHTQRIARLVAFIAGKGPPYATRDQRALRALARSALDDLLAELDLDECVLDLAPDVAGFNAAIRDAARERGLTPAELAEATGLRLIPCATFLGGAAVTRTGAALAIAAALDLDLRVRPRVRSAPIPDSARPARLQVLGP